MELGIRNRVAMVAAASKGLGRAIAESLAREGCRLSICSRSLESLEPVRDALGGDALAVACDVSRPEDLQRWYDETVGRFGQVKCVGRGAPRTGGSGLDGRPVLEEQPFAQLISHASSSLGRDEASKEALSVEEEFTILGVVTPIEGSTNVISWTYKCDDAPPAALVRYRGVRSCRAP